MDLVNRSSKKKIIISLFIISLVVIFVATEVSFVYVSNYVDNSYRQELLSFAKVVSASIDGDKLSELSATPADYGNEEFQRLQYKLTKMGDISSLVRYIYILGGRGGNDFYFYIDSQPSRFSDDLEAEPLAVPGEEYIDDSGDFAATLNEGKDITSGIYSDKWGTFVSVSVPIFNQKGERVPAILGVDMEAALLSQRLLFNKLMILSLSGALTLIAVLLFSLFYSIESSRLKLEKERLRFKLYLDLAPAIVVGLDVSGKVSMINKFGYSLLEGEKSEILGKNWFDNFLTKKNRAEVKKSFEGLIKGDILTQEKLNLIEGDILTLSGKIRRILWNNSTVSNSLGEVVEVISFGQDITDRMTSEAELIKRNEQLERLNALMVSRELEMKKLKEFNKK